MSEELKPCPFCGSKSLDIQEMTIWTGRTNRVLSYQIQHHCRGDIGNFLQVRGRTENSLIAAWNSRYDGDDCRESGM